MSDFSELCPLFNTGVYHEVVFPMIDAGTGLMIDAATQNLLESLSITAGDAGNNFKFGRTVVVTEAYVQRYTTATTANNLILHHRATAAATPTAFATYNVTATMSAYSRHAWMPFTFSTSKTFTSNEVLGLNWGTLTALTNGCYNMIVRYRDK